MNAGRSGGICCVRFSGRGRNRREPVAPAPDESIRSARVGDVLTISGYSVEYDDRLFFIERIHRYSSPSDTWYELLCVEGDDRLWVDWTDGRELSVTVTEDTGPSGLTATGLTEEDLIQLDEEHSIDNYVTIDGDNYYYRNSAEVLFFQDNRGPGDAYYQWDFLRERGRYGARPSPSGQGQPLRGGLSAMPIASPKASPSTRASGGSQ